MKVSILMAVKNRARLLKRCLHSYTKLSYPDYELLVIDDGSRENIGEIYNSFHGQLPLQYHRLDSPNDRTPARAWNYGFEHSTGEFVICTNGDLLISEPDLIERMLAHYRDIRISVLTYFLTSKMTVMLNEIDWYGNPKLIEALPEFWTADVSGQTNSQRTAAGIVTYLTGQSRAAWEWIGLFRNDESHLTCDQDLVLRERALGREVDTLPGYVLYHQYHEPAAVLTGPGYRYENEQQARLLEPAPKE